LNIEFVPIFKVLSMCKDLGELGFWDFNADEW